MRTNLSINLLCGFLVPLIGLPSLSAAQLPVVQDREGTQDGVAQNQKQETEETITVHLASGRSFTAKIDPRTDSTQLWLRWERGSAVLRRPIRWDRVVRARVTGRELSGKEFYQIVQTIRRDAPAQAETAAAQRTIGIPGSTERTRSIPAVRSTPYQERKTPRVRSLAMDALVANWDADVEVDGLLVHVYPLDADGAVVPVRGSLEVDLRGQWHNAVPRPQSFLGLGRWTRQVRFEDFGPRGAVYRLPFQGVHPEFDPAVAPHGAVHARLSVPGQGTFETTESTVRIRPYGAVRDDLQQATGRRFFPQERTGEGRR